MAYAINNIGAIYKINIDGNMTPCIVISEWKEYTIINEDDFYLGTATPYNVEYIRNLTFTKRLKTENQIYSNSTVKILTLYKCCQLLIGDKKVWLPKYQETIWPI